MKLSKVVYTQELHCCASPTNCDEGKLEIEVCDGGGGDYIVVTAREWALDKDEEIDAFASILKTALRTPPPYDHNL